MQIEVGITLNASPALLEALSNLAAGLTAEAAVTRASRKPIASKAGAEVKTAPVAAPAVSDTAAPAETEGAQPGKPPAAPASVTSTTPPPDSFTVAQVRAAFANLAGRDRAAAITILEKHGAKSVSSLSPAAYAEVMAEVEAALA